VLEVKKPKYFVLENVKGILGVKAQAVYTSLVDGLKLNGYDVKIKKLNSKEHGTPQNRERVFFIGKFGVWSPSEFEFPPKEKLLLNVLDILEDNPSRREPQIKKMKLNKKINQKKYGDITRFEAILQNPVSKRNSNVMFEILDAPSDAVSRQSDRIYSPIFSPCLTATGKDYLFYVKGEVIVLTPKECFRLMGFFNDEIKLGDLKDSQKHKLAGNGWDINLVSKIFKEMFK
jgi:DNA (cytosine-5)-methyltransferase 1